MAIDYILFPVACSMCKRREPNLSSCGVTIVTVFYAAKMTLDEIKRKAKGSLVEHLGLEWEYVRSGETKAYFQIKPFHLAPNGYLHAASVIALADTCCGFGCLESLPPNGESFTTIELKSNFLATARQGQVGCIATMAHGGKTTQVWDATVTDENDKVIAMFRCTQFILYPRK